VSEATLVAQLSTVTILALVAGVLIALAFTGGLIAYAMRRRGPRGPDIPTGMRPGPPDEVLERRQLERVMGWGVVFVLFFATWMPLYWLGEPNRNVENEIELIDRSTARGGQWFQIADEDNPTGFGCARCHGAEAEGGSVPFTTPDGQTIQYAVPPLNDVCGGATTGHPAISSIDDIRATIEQGREGTPMPSWSVKFEGPMNDQQISDLINYIVSIQQDVPKDQNICTNPAAAAEAEAAAEDTGTPAAEPPATDTGTGGASPTSTETASPSPESTR
jgi:mono/diheme cytochrome c family protein